MRRIALLVSLVMVVSAACGRVQPPPERPAVAGSSPSNGADPPTPTPSTRLPTPTASGSVPGMFPESSAVNCAGRPSADQVIAVLRRERKLPSAGTVRVPTGPLCAGLWQYTVVALPNREPLQVVTRGLPGALMVVTTGTNVCTPEVTAAAPAGIVTAARCG